MAPNLKQYEKKNQGYNHTGNTQLLNLSLGTEETSLICCHPCLSIIIKHTFRIDTHELLNFKAPASRQFLCCFVLFTSDGTLETGHPQLCNFAALGILQIIVPAFTVFHVAHIKKWLHIHRLVVQFKAQ